MNGEAKGDQINEPRGMGVQEAKTQDVGKYQRGRGSKLGQLFAWSLSKRAGEGTGSGQLPQGGIRCLKGIYKVL